MADVEDAACAPPPFFEGDPDLPEVPQSFPWDDLLEGTGNFCVEDANARWKKMSSTTKDGVSVICFSRSLDDKGGLCEFLIRGSLPVARDTYFCVNADMEYRPEWDETCVSLAELSSSGPGPAAGPFVRRDRVLHWNVNYPWPLGKRDYVLEQTVFSGVQQRDGKVYRCTQSRSVDAQVGKKLRPSEKGITRIEDYRAHMAIWSGANEQEARFAVLCFEDGKLNVPNWVLTKAAATTIPAQLAGFVPVVLKYPQKRLQSMLTRYGANDAKVLSTPRRGETFVGHDDIDNRDADDEAFYSASDDESSPVDTTPLRLKVGKSQQSPLARSAAKVSLEIAGKPPPPSPVMRPASKGPLEKLTAPKKGLAGGKAQDRKMASKLESVLRLVLPQQGDDSNFQDDSDEGDLEEGVLIVGKEERDLLLSLLAEARAKQSTHWWWCPCRRRRGHKGKHKQ